MAPPGEGGYRLASDRAPHERCVMRWPALVAAAEWRGHLGAARDTIAIIARAIAELEPVLMVADVGEGRAAQMWLGDGIDVVELACPGGWIRDAGPLFVLDTNGHRLGVTTPAEDPTGVAAMELCAHLGIEGVAASGRVAGGAVVTDGHGRAIAAGLVDDHPGAGEADGSPLDALDTDLERWLGLDDVVRLPPAGPNRADRAVDRLVSVIDDGRVLLQSTHDAADEPGATAPHRTHLEDGGYAVEVIDALPHDRVFGETHAVPFVNLYHANGGVIVPLSGSAVDREVLVQLQELFPDDRIVGVPGRILAFGGGGVRRLTLPVPTGA